VTTRQDWDRYIDSAEAETDLGKARAYLEQAEVSLFQGGAAFVGCSNGSDHALILRQASEKILRIKKERLNWPDSFSSITPDKHEV
jgi:hypothetical protein